MTRAEFFFLFRTDQGEIPRGVWRRGMVQILSPILVLSLAWLALEPYARPDAGAFRPLTLVAFLYVLIYAFAVILSAVCFYNLSAKRFRARGYAGAFAGLVPFTALLTGAAFWLVPRSEGYVPPLIAYGLAALCAASAVWTALELGVFGDATAP